MGNLMRGNLGQDNLVNDNLTYAEQLKGVDFRTVDPSYLVDINDVKVSRDLPQQERAVDFIRQIRNPYLYKCGDMIVKVSFADTDETLEDRLEGYFKTLQ